MSIALATPEPDSRISHYESVVNDPGIEWRGTVCRPFDGPSLNRVQGIIVSDEWHAPTRIAIAECKQRGIAVFHVIDGTLEWRNLFENPRSAEPENGSPLFQPLIADHAFCMGAVQKWQLEWLGNTTIHATGLPRLDRLLVRPCLPRATSSLPNLLIATANTPWFTPDQHVLFTAEFGRLVALCQRETSRSNPAFSVSWRISEKAAAELGIEVDNEVSAAEALAKSSALITTPSTLAVEAMLMGVPTLVFDPFASPVFIPTAWHATSADSAFSLVPSLLHPDRQRCQLQDSLRALLTPIDQGAARRVRECIFEVIRSAEAGTSADLAQPPSVTKAPLHDFSSFDPAKHFSPSDIQGLISTLPSLGATIRRQNARIEELEQQLFTPNLASGLRVFARAIRCSVRR